MYEFISDQNRKKMIFEKILQNKIKLRYWAPPEDPIFLQIINGSAAALTCQGIPAQTKIFSQSESFRFCFDLNDDDFMFEAKVRIENNNVVLFPKEDLLIVQKRKEFRINLPADYPAHLEILSASNIRCSFRGHIHNITNFGCRAAFAKESIHLKNGQVIVGNVKIGSQDSIQLAAIIKGVQADSKQTFISLEFNHIVYNSEDKLNTALIMMQRELFKKS